MGLLISWSCCSLAWPLRENKEEEEEEEEEAALLR